jgi:hypothetical protein
LLEDAEYEELRIEIEQAYLAKPKSNRQNYLVKTYEIYEIAEIKKIIKKREDLNNPVQYLVPKNDMFDTILACHEKVGHKGFFTLLFILSN